MQYFYIVHISHCHPHLVEFMIFVHFINEGNINSELSDQIIGTNEVVIHQTDLYHACFQILTLQVGELEEQL